MTRALVVLALALCGVAGAQPRPAPSPTPIDKLLDPNANPTNDYDPHSGAWNGMASFVGLAQGMGYDVTAVEHLEWDDLSASDILFLIYPLQRVDPQRLGAFVAAGGNVVIADDFGEGKDAMQSLGLLRADVTTPKASKFEGGRLWAPIATPRADHPLAAEVGELVTNHPAALVHVEGATNVLGFDEGSVVVAGERGTGRFVAISDPSIFINRMQQWKGDVQLAANLLRWLDRDGRARHVVLLRGDVPMYGEPPPFIDDAHMSPTSRSVASFNMWLGDWHLWLLTPRAMKVLAAILALVLLVLAMLALPVRKGPNIDGGWLKFARPHRRDEPHALIAAHDDGAGSNLVAACVLRDVAQHALAQAVGKPEPLYTVAEPELVSLVTKAKGLDAGSSLARVYKRLRALPGRGHAAAPWSQGQLPRREFDALYRDVADLCRTLGAAIDV